MSKLEPVSLTLQVFSVLRNYVRIPQQCRSSLSLFNPFVDQTQAFRCTEFLESWGTFSAQWFTQSLQGLYACLSHRYHRGFHWNTQRCSRKNVNLHFGVNCTFKFLVEEKTHHHHVCRARAVVFEHRMNRSRLQQRRAGAARRGVALRAVFLTCQKKISSYCLLFLSFFLKRNCDMQRLWEWREWRVRAGGRVCHLSEGQNSALFNERRLFINAEFVQDI